MPALLEPNPLLNTDISDKFSNGGMCFIHLYATLTATPPSTHAVSNNAGVDGGVVVGGVGFGPTAAPADGGWWWWWWWWRSW